jgi:hypothetical protein
LDIADKVVALMRFEDPYREFVVVTDKTLKHK